MNKLLITDLVDQQVFTQLGELDKRLDTTKGKLIEASKSLIELSKSAGSTSGLAAYLQWLNNVSGKLQDTDKNLKEVAATYSQYKKVLDEVANKVKDHGAALTKEERLQKKLADTKKASAIEEEKLTQEIKKNRAEIKAQVREQQAQENSVEQLRAKVARLRLEWANMDKGSPGFLNKTKELKEAIEELNSLSESSESIFDGIAESLGSFALASISVTAFIGAVASGIRTIIQFQQANANLATTLGKSKSEITELTYSAKELGKITEWAASQITQLQIELAKLGFNEKEILNMQAPVLQFATAIGADLPEAAELAGAALRQFELDSTQTQRVVSSMTVAADKSALSFEYFKSAMSTVAPVANKFGFEIEDTIALLGVLSDSGFDASVAATATRNILLNLADSSGKLSIELGKPVKTFGELVDGLDELNRKGLDLGKVLELTDQRSVAAMSTLIAGSGQLRKLREEVTGVGDELGKIQRERLDTVEGSVKLLNGAWEGLMLSFSNSTGIMKSVVNSLTGVVKMINDAIKTSGDAVLAYNKQIDKVADLERNIVPLIERYKDLKSNAKLNVDEQKELENIIRQISNTLPGVISEFDKYGKAIDINTDKVYANIEAEKLRRQWVYREAIKETEEALSKSKEQYKILTAIYERGGDYYKGQFIQFSQAKLNEIRLQRETVGKTLRGQESELENLKGTSIEKASIRAKFNRMNEQQLGEWLANEENAKGEYADIAKEVLAEFKETEKTKEASVANLGEAYADAKKKWEAAKKVLDQISKDRSKYTTTELEEAEEAEKAAKVAYEKLGGITGKALKKSGDEALKIQQQLQDSELELMDESLKYEIAKIELNYDKRIKAIKGGSDEEKKLRENLEKEKRQTVEKFTSEYELNREQKNLQNKLAFVKEGSEEELNTRLALIENQRKQEVKAAEKTGEHISLINKKFDSLRLEAHEDHVTKLIELNTKRYKEQAEELNTAYLKEQAILSSQYADKLISKEKFERESEKLTKKYALSSKKVTITAMNEQVALLKKHLETMSDKLPEEAIKEIQKKIKEFEGQIITVGIEVDIQVGDEAKKGGVQDYFESILNWLEDHEREVNQAIELYHSLFELTDALFDRRIQKIEEEQRANQDAYDADIERIERLAEIGVITAEDAEVRKRAAKKETAAKEAELAKKKAALQERQAKFEKANNIVQTIANTAASIIKTGAQLGFPAAIPFIALAALTGAVQLATIIAQPIPKYAKGTDNHPGGSAIVGDGGKKELALLPSGKMFVTPNTPTLVDMPKGTIVLPEIPTIDQLKAYASHDIRLMMQRSEGRMGEPPVIRVSTDTVALQQEIKGGLEETNSLLKKQMKQQKRSMEYMAFKNRMNNIGM